MASIFSEENNIRQGLAPDADRYNTDPATDVVNTKYYGHTTFIVEHGAGATGTAVVTVEECTAADGTGATAIPFKYRLYAITAAQGALTDATASGFTITAGANKLAVIEVPSRSLSDGSPYVRVQLTEGVDSPVDASVLIIQSQPRYAGTLDTGLT